MSTTYYTTCYTGYALNCEEKFFHKEFSPKMVIEQLQFCKQNGKIEAIEINETELRGYVSFLAQMNDGEKRFYRFYNDNTIALRRMFRKFSKASWRI